MSQSKLNDLAGKFGKGGSAPPGLALGLKVLAVVGAAAYGATKSVYTGKSPISKKLHNYFVNFGSSVQIRQKQHNLNEIKLEINAFVM